jgi:hypothetical protein
MRSEASSWRRRVSDALFVLGAVALASLLFNGNVAWLVCALLIGVVSLAMSHRLFPWHARFGDSDSPALTPPRHERTKLPSSRSNSE